MDKTLFEKSLVDLKLNTGWFNEIPRDLFYLAVSPNISGPSSEFFIQKYGTNNHQLLEFYGDRVLALVANMIIFQLYGLASKPVIVQKLYEQLTNNSALLQITIEERFCVDLIKSNTCKYTMPTTKHNICGDSLEAIMGAIYYYGLSQNRVNLTKDIYTWFVSFESVTYFLSDYFGQPRENVIDLLNIKHPPIDWDTEIDIGNLKDLWKSCKESSPKFRGRSYGYRSFKPRR